MIQIIYYNKSLVPHGRSRPLSQGVAQASPIYFSYPYDNIHGQKPNKHMPQHPVHEIQHYVDLFKYHNVVPI
ncbi:hypothetical protein ACFX19_002417 [Malus domestica]